MRILTYNVHSCIGTDGRCSPERIVDVIAACEPDVVCLQELDVGRAKTGGVDQAHLIGRGLGMEMHFHAAVRVMEEQFGDAILTSLPSRLVRAGPLPGLSGMPLGRWGETRGALWADIDTGGAHVQVINTHLGLRPREQMVQMPALAGPDWLGHPDCIDPVLLAGDFNAFPGTRAYRYLASFLDDTQCAPAVRQPRATFPGRAPMIRIDHVFSRGPIEVVSAHVVRTRLSRVASDHLPLLVEVRIPPAQAIVSGRDSHRTSDTDLGERP
ncbi:MAG: endonuclease/exonuclease/phosphatase family protein [Alphaproteobacteria bacterium]